MFKKVYNNESSFGRILNAISAFERTLVSRNVPFDKFIEGDKGAISAQAKQGYDLFTGKAGCIRCHNGPMLTDSNAYNLGVPHNPKIVSEVRRHITMRSMMMFLGVPAYHRLQKDPGYFVVTKEYKDFGSFQTPSLREASRTAPYMHNGMVPTLAAVVDFYNAGGGDHKDKSGMLKPLGLSASEKKALVAFLETLSGDPINIEVPKTSLPKYKAIPNWLTKKN
jgi:cytochrome c peroxidase